MDNALTHLGPDGSARMVDVGSKPETERRAIAQAVVSTTPEVLALLSTGGLPKGDALAVARIAGISGAKHTATLIPLCHPLPITSADVALELGSSAVTITATVATVGRTGVEMEALTAATVSALALYDMIKAVDRSAVIGDVRLLEKSGGKSGAWSAS